MTQSLLSVAALPYTLVIVDMQPGFEASQAHSVILGVQTEIRHAMAGGHHIVVIESDPSEYGQTDERLMQLLANYDSDRWTVECKSYSYERQYWAHSGAFQVAEACEVFEFPSSRFRVCGVNTHICVFFTAMELGKLFPESTIQLVAPACNDQYCETPGYALWSFHYYAEQHGFSNYVIEGGVAIPPR